MGKITNQMKTIGITGQNGFIGSHLLNHISLLKNEFTLIPFDKTYFQHQRTLQNWVKKCDVIVHLAAINRHTDSAVIYNTNIDLVRILIEALESVTHNPHIIFSSSTQEEKGNLYGRSKQEGRKLLVKWGKENKACVTGMIVPNVYGPFGKPFYNSVISTFCHQLCNGLIPTIDNDANLKIIYINELTDAIIQTIKEEKNESEYNISHTSENSVSDLLDRLKSYRDIYLVQGIIPPLPNRFSVNLFNTFRSFIDQKSYFPFILKQNKDQRGIFVEMIKLNLGGQLSFSTTLTGITRGNHFHTRKIERFIVIKGKALIQLRKYNTNEVLNFELDGDNPSYVDMPVWYTHNIKNIGKEDLYTVFWINEFYDDKDPDTFFETV